MSVSVLRDRESQIVVDFLMCRKNYGGNDYNLEMGIYCIDYKIKVQALDLRSEG